MMLIVSLFFLVGSAATPVDDYTARMRFPLRRILQGLSDANALSDGEQSRCSSLNGPSCPVAMQLDSTDEDDAYEGDGEKVMARVKELSQERAKAQAKRTRDAAAQNKKKAVDLEKDRLARVRRSGKIRKDPRENAKSMYERVVREPPAKPPTRPSPAEYFAAMQSASIDVECAVCKALERESHTFAGAITPSGNPVPETNVLEHIRESGSGDVPRLLHSLAIVPMPPDEEETGENTLPKGKKNRFVLCERDGKSSLTNFEQRAFQRACASVVDDVDLELAEAAVVNAKTTSLGFSITGRRSACDSFCGGENGEEKSRDLSGSRPTPPEVSLRTGGFDGGACVYSAKGYWAWEVCFEQRVRQFHADFPDVYQVVSLGEFEAQGVGGSALDAIDLPIGWEEHRFRYFEQFFAGGTFCEGVSDPSTPNRPTGPGRARRSVVRWACSPDGHERVVSREPSPCSYHVTVFTNALCEHPEFTAVKPVGKT